MLSIFTDSVFRYLNRNRLEVKFGAVSPSTLRVFLLIVLSAEYLTVSQLTKFSLLLMFGVVLVCSCIQIEKSLTRMSNNVSPAVIGAEQVDKADYPAVLSIRTGSAGCTATLVGPKVIATAAHCGKSGQQAKFSIGGVQYSAVLLRSDIYPAQDHDIALGLIGGRGVEGVEPISVGETAQIGSDMYIMGYGCTQKGGGGGNDGILRAGTAELRSFTKYDAVLQGGAALCFGDSGGPTMVKTKTGSRGQEQYEIAAVNSKGDIKVTSYVARLDTQASKDFMQSFISQYNVEICGVNLDCNGDAPSEFVLENKFTKVRVTVKDSELMSEAYLKTNFENLMRYLEAQETGFEFSSP